ncbi:MAG: nitroreductase family protein [Deltaproteobacteria bacterium]|nr:nitroreductase family protein [Deltaproteobacteria bacterium]
MTILELLAGRKATRAIAIEALDRTVIGDLAEAARLTPSCYNKQPWRFLFVTSDEGRDRVVGCLADGNKPWALRAPLFVVASSRVSDDCELPDGRRYHQFDLGMSVMNLMLAATEQGLVARPMAGFDSGAIRQAFGLDEQDEPMVVVAVGKPSEDESHLPDSFSGLGDRPRQRRPVEEIVTWK